MHSRGRTLAPKPAVAASSGRHVRLLAGADAPCLAAQATTEAEGRGDWR